MSRAKLSGGEGLPSKGGASQQGRGLPAEEGLPIGGGASQRGRGLPAGWLLCIED